MTEPRLFAPPAPKNPATAASATPDSELRVRITATMGYTLSVPASWVEDEEFLADPEEAVFTWITDNAGQCINEADLMDHTVWPTPGRQVPA
jgi:hypothetical protein